MCDETDDARVGAGDEETNKRVIASRLMDDGHVYARMRDGIIDVLAICTQWLSTQSG